MQSLAGGRAMKYPYTVTAKLAQFPYRWHWKHGRFVRFLGFTLLGIFPLIVKIHSAGKHHIFMCEVIIWACAKSSFSLYIFIWIVQ